MDANLDPIRAIASARPRTSLRRSRAFRLGRSRLARTRDFFNEIVSPSHLRSIDRAAAGFGRSDEPQKFSGCSERRVLRPRLQTDRTPDCRWNDDRAALGFCSDVTLADLSKILTAQFANDFKVQRAINLDGGSSSAFWFKRANGSVFSISEQKTVRDFVAVVPR